MTGLWKMCAAAVVVAVVGFTGTAGAQVKVQGAGATFPAPLYAQWTEAFNKAHPDVKVDYQAVGSGGGIKGITDRTVIFGASDAPMTAEQEKAAPGKLLHLPMVAGPEVLIYNLDGVPKLTLNGDVVADIFLNKIKNWNDAKIAALNPGVALPAQKIVVAHRSDGSGTTFIFTDYLAKVSKEWQDNVGVGTTVDWPFGIAGKGNDGVAQTVTNTKGGIGYVEYAFAKNKNLPFADLQNKNGKVVPPTLDAIIAAAASVKVFPDDMKVSITNTDGADAYPICGFTYLLVYQDMSYTKDKAASAAMVDYIKWCVTDGQDAAAALGYAKLPPEVQSKVLEKLKTVTFDGQPLLK